MMAKTNQHPNERLPLNHADLHILVSLTGGDRHGYAIMQDVRSLSGERVRLGPGTLYTAIKRLLEAGLIEESDRRPDPELDDQRRRYYRLTRYGRRVAAAEAERLQGIVRVMQERRLISPPQAARGSI